MLLFTFLLVLITQDLTSDKGVVLTQSTLTHPFHISIRILCKYKKFGVTFVIDIESNSWFSFKSFGCNQRWLVLTFNFVFQSYRVIRLGFKIFRVVLFMKPNLRN